VGSDPGRLRVAYSPRTPEGPLGHPDCLAALDDAARMLTSLGHEVAEVALDGITPRVGAAIGTLVNAVSSWIVRFWSREIGREPAAGELEPGTRALWEAGETVSAAEYLLAIEDLQVFSRWVAAFLADFDVWLTPTMSAPPLLIGEMTSTDDDPMRALVRGAETIRYAGIIANITGNPAMSVPLWWNDAGLPIGVHFMGHFGDEATLYRLASQLEAARPWTERRPPVSAW
jgi:amidase